MPPAQDKEMMVCQSIMEEIAKKSTKVLQNEVVPSFHLAPMRNAHT